MRTLTLHTADELVERWRRRASELDISAHAHDYLERGGRQLAALDRERAQAYRVCAAELLAILAASMEMEAAHHGDPEWNVCRWCKRDIRSLPDGPTAWHVLDEGPVFLCSQHPDEDGIGAHEPETADPNALREWLAGERP